jgi:hypothetical protein
MVDGVCLKAAATHPAAPRVVPKLGEYVPVDDTSWSSMPIELPRVVEDAVASLSVNPDAGEFGVELFGVATPPIMVSLALVVVIDPQVVVAPVPEAELLPSVTFWSMEYSAIHWIP